MRKSTSGHMTKKDRNRAKSKRSATVKREAVQRAAETNGTPRNAVQGRRGPAWPAQGHGSAAARRAQATLRR